MCVCSESMNDVTDNAKNNFGDPLVRFSLLLRARAFVENTHSCVVIVFVARQIV